MLNDPITRWAIALDIAGALALTAGLLALWAPSVVVGTVLASRTVALSLTVIGALVWVLAAGMLVSRLLSARRRNP